MWVCEDVTKNVVFGMKTTFLLEAEKNELCCLKKKKSNKKKTDSIGSSTGKEVNSLWRVFEIGFHNVRVWGKKKIC